MKCEELAVVKVSTQHCWECATSTIPIITSCRDPNKAEARQLNHGELCMCGTDCVCEFVDCFITSWAGLRSVLQVTWVTLEATQEQRGPDLETKSLTLSDMQKQTQMVTVHNPVTGCMGTEPEFVCTDSGVGPKTLSRETFSRIMSVCCYLTYGIFIHFLFLRELLMYSLFILGVNA